MSTLDKWDFRFLRLAEHISEWSKDPSTKVGAVIADPSNRIVSVGFNGFAARVHDSPSRLEDRDQKLAMTIHGDLNAILFARQSLVGCTMYTWPFAPCSNCASVIVQVGIRRVVAPKLPSNHRWTASVELARLLFNEAGVQLDLT